MIKVLITGAFSTGKTTLTKKLQRKLLERGLRVDLTPEVARLCPFPLNRAQGREATIWLLTRQISLELEGAIQEPDILLCDRGIPDIIAHYMEVVQRLGPVSEIERLLPFFSDWSKNYEVILISEIDHRIPPKADRIREENPEFRSQMEEFSKCALLLMGLSGSRLPFGSAPRLAYALEEVTARLPPLTGG